MRVSRAKAAESRQNILKWAARLFRERGYDGVGLKELMHAAGLTSGAFYGKFGSKEDLAILASEAALAEGVSVLVESLERDREDPLGRVVGDYLFEAHRDGTGDGCMFAALGGAATRHAPALQRAFEEGLVAHLEVIDRAIASSPGAGRRRDAAAVFATMVGALVLSRVAKDPGLSKRFLETAVDSIARRSGRSSVAATAVLSGPGDLLCDSAC